jgi:hypothetical protein
MTPDHLKCGFPLKTRPCGRSAWWPGGRCPRHGYGASSFEEWIRGLERRENVSPVYWNIFCRNGEVTPIEIYWKIYGWHNDKYEIFDSGVIDKNKLPILSDMFQEEGIFEKDEIDLVDSVIEEYNRHIRQKSGELESSRKLARELRKLGYQASSSHDGVEISNSSIKEILSQLGVVITND